MSGAHISVHPKKAAFLAAYAECGIVTAACRASDVGRRTHYDWLEEDAEYRAAFEEAHETAIESLESEARRRAVDGWDEPVFHEGGVCGHKRKYSDTLLIFMMKGAAPEKYRDVVETKHSGKVEHGGSINIHAVLEALQDNDEFREFARARCSNGHAGLLGSNSEQGKVGAGPASNGHRSSRNGHDRGTNGKEHPGH